MAKSPKYPVFTDEEKKTIQSAAAAVWQYIGDDMIQSTAECEGISPEEVSIKRAVVVEVVIDADRLHQRLVDDGHIALAGKFENADYEQMKRLVRPAFPYGSYGL